MKSSSRSVLSTTRAATENTIKEVNERKERPEKRKRANADMPKPPLQQTGHKPGSKKMKADADMPKPPLQQTGHKPDTKRPDSKKRRRVHLRYRLPSSWSSWTEVKNWNADKNEYENLIKCAILAIEDYNGQEDIEYKLIQIEKVHCQLVAGVRYAITLRARNSKDEYTFPSCKDEDTFVAHVVNRITIKGAINDVVWIKNKKDGTSHNGTLTSPQPILLLVPNDTRPTT